MIKRLHYSTKSKWNLESFLSKRRQGKNVDTTIVKKILRDIKKNREKAVIKYETKFNNNKKIKVSKKEIIQSIKNLDFKVKKALDNAYSRIYKFHSLQKTKDIKFVDKLNNKIEYKNVPLKTVGIYVPANLPSTLLMNAIPAKISGVKNIVLANPRLNQKLNPAVMYVAQKCGITKVISVGGAQAIGCLAYIEKVDKIVGPGNDYVAQAKREVFGEVGIEGMIAGPSEITVIADKKSNVNQIATSLIAQSEHGVNSQSILVTKEKAIASKVESKLKEIIKRSPRKSIIKKSLKTNGLIIIAKNENQIIDIVNTISPEHLEILSFNFKKYLNNIFNAGTIAIGKYSPVAASDYNVGTNHTLGTLGSSRFASGLNLNDFYKKISRFQLSRKGLKVIGKQAITLAEYENLFSHALSIKSRIKEE